MRSLPLVRILLAWLVALGFLSAPSAQAQTHTWDGGGANNNWSDVNNWTAAGAPAQPGTGVADIIFGGVLRLSPNVQAAYDVDSITFNNTAGAFNLTSSGGGTLTVRGGGITNNDADNQTFGNVPLILGANQTWNAASGDLTFGISSTVNLGGNQLTLSGANDINFNNPVSGAGGSIVKNGAGELVLINGSQTYTGGFTMNAGTFTMNAANPVGSGGTFTINGGTIRSTGFAPTIANPTTFGGNFTIGGTSNITLTGPATLTGTRTVTVDNTGSTTFSGAIGQTAGFGISKNGAGTLTFSGATANTYVGATAINAGTLVLNKTAGVNAIAGEVNVGDSFGSANSEVLRLGSSSQISDSSNVTVFSAGLFDLNGNSETIASLGLNGGTVTTGTGTLTIGGILSTGLTAPTASTLSGNLNLGGATQTFNIFDGAGAMDLDIPAVISNGGINFQANTGTTRLSAANTFTGGVTLNSGNVLLIGHDQALGVGGTFTVSGGTVQADGATIPIVANPVTLGGNLNVAGSLGLAFTGPVALNGDRTLNVTNTGQTTMSGVISDSGGSRSLTKNGAGTLTFTGFAGSANTYSGQTIVNDGRLHLQKNTGVTSIAGALTIGDGTGAAQSAVVFQQNSNQINDASSVAIRGDGLWDLNGQAETIAALTFTGGSIGNLNGTLTINGPVTSNDVAGLTANIFSEGQLNLGGATRIFTVADSNVPTDLGIENVIANGGLTKAGPGTLNFFGALANTYTGTTTVNEGTLSLSKTANAVGFSGPLVIGDGVGLDVVRTLNSGLLPGSQPVTINSSGVLDNLFNSSVGSLTMAGGHVNGAAILQLRGDVTHVGSTGSTIQQATVSLFNGTRTFDVQDAAGTLDINAVVALGGITKAGLGELALVGSASNTYTGLTTVNAGRLTLVKTGGAVAVPGNLTLGDGTATDVVDVAGNEQIGDTSAVTVNSSGQLVIQTGVTETIGTLTMTGGSVTGGTLRVLGPLTTNANAGSASISSTLDLSGAIRVATVADGAAADDLVVSGALQNGTLHKAGAGTLRLTGAAANTASLQQISSGTLILDKDAGMNAFGGASAIIGDGAGGAQSDVLRYGASDHQLSDAITLIVNPSGLLDLAGRSDTIGSLTFAGSGRVETGTGTLTVVNAVTANATTSAGTFNGNLDLGGDVLPFRVHDSTSANDLIVNALMSNGTLRKEGLGTLVLDGSANHDVSVELVAGTLAGGFILAPGRTFTQSPGSTFGGGGVLENRGTFTYDGGTFTGTLANLGTTLFNADFTAGDGITNDGTFVVSTGRTVSGGLPGVYNSPVGTITLAGGTIRDEFVNDGVVSGHGQLTGVEGFTNRGQLTVTGGTLTVANTSAFNSNLGTIAVGASQQLSLATAFLNQGLITLSGGTVSGAGVLTNGLGGEIRGGSSVQSPLVNDGGLIHAAGTGILTIANLSGGNINGGELRADDGATLNVVSNFSSTGTIALNGPDASLTGGAITHSGTLRGQGRITNVVLNSGTLRAENGTLTLAALANTNAAGGRIEAGPGAQVLYSRGLAVNSGQIALTGGSLDNNNNALANPGAIEGYGTLRTGGLTNTGTVSVGGSLDLLGAVTNQSTVSTHSGTTVRFFGPVNGAGNYPGPGTVMFLNSFSPGNSPASIDFGGNAVFTPANTLTMELAGTTPGTQYDQLHVAGSASLAGTLHIDLLDGFNPAANNAFTLLTYANHTGTFSTVDLPALPGGLNWSLNYHPTSLILSVTSNTLLPGDIDLDGDVDRTDARLFTNFLGTTSGSVWTTGDFNNDGLTSLADLAILQAHLGQTAPSPSPAAAVPEPTSAALAVLAAAIALVGLRRRCII